MIQRGLFDPPPSPPTGPVPAVVPRAVDGFRGRYEEWRGGIGGEAYAAIRNWARSDVACGGRRISTKALVERARSLYKIPINNTFTPYIADDLISECPDLLERIERRGRSAHYSPNAPEPRRRTIDLNALERLIVERIREYYGGAADTLVSEIRFIIEKIEAR